MSGPDPRPRAGWYLLPAVKRKGPVAGLSVGESEIVTFHDGLGQRAVSAHCPHMGIHLAAGSVTSGTLRCPLHAWSFDGTGRCVSAPGWREPPAASLDRFRVEELSGVSFVGLGSRSGSPPALGLWRERRLRFVRGEPLHLSAPWTGIAANGFDATHLSIVHRRRVEGPAVVETGDGFFRVRYEATVEGGALADRLTRAMSGGRVENVITAWGGSVLIVETRLGSGGAALLLGLIPTSGGTEVSPVFGVPCRAAWFDVVAVRIARFLFRKFLARDVEILEGMRFAPRFLRDEDAVLASFLDYLRSVPVLDNSREG